ncbi:MAG: hypothetical protein PHW27_01915 [Melioribacteraceae bacterium]|nr:hypothetical protein [Melioribacteraceae bacterium]MDD3557304.1 hypothetical protein [Melioribacteraceae bacterium]
MCDKNYEIFLLNLFKYSVNKSIVEKMSADITRILLKLKIRDNQMLSLECTSETIVSEIEHYISTYSKNLDLSNIFNTRTIPKGSYLIKNDIYIHEGGCLNIEHGVQLYFSKDCGIIAYGKLMAQGIAEDPIVITGNNWSNLIFLQNSLLSGINNILEYVIIHGGRSRYTCPIGANKYTSINLNGLGGNICVIDADLNLNQSIISSGHSKRGGGIFSYKGNIKLTDSIFCNNEATRNGGIELNMASSVGNKSSHLNNILIDSNKSKTSAGGIAIEKGIVDLMNLAIVNNYSEESCGGITIHHSILSDPKHIGKEYVRLSNSVITNNSGSTEGGLYTANCHITDPITASNRIYNNTARDTDAHDIQQSFYK